MNYETYDKDKHTLEVGLPIRLAGREGEITDIVVVGAEDIFTITWSDTRSTSRLNIYRFPNLEVMDKPLTIDKRVTLKPFCLIGMVKKCLRKKLRNISYLRYAHLSKDTIKAVVLQTKKI